MCEIAKGHCYTARHAILDLETKARKETYTALWNIHRWYGSCRVRSMLTVDQRTTTAPLERYITNIEIAYNSVYAFLCVAFLLTSG